MPIIPAPGGEGRRTLSLRSVWGESGLHCRPCVKEIGERRKGKGREGRRGRGEGRGGEKEEEREEEKNMNSK